MTQPSDERKPREFALECESGIVLDGNLIVGELPEESCEIFAIEKDAYDDLAKERNEWESAYHEAMKRGDKFKAELAAAKAELAEIKERLNPKSDPGSAAIEYEKAYQDYVLGVVPRLMEKLTACQKDWERLNIMCGDYSLENERLEKQLTEARAEIDRLEHIQSITRHSADIQVEENAKEFRKQIQSRDALLDRCERFISFHIGTDNKATELFAELKARKKASR